MEKLLKELKTEIEKFRIENEKKQKEMINYLSFQAQVQKQILNQLIKLNKEKDGDN